MVTTANWKILALIIWFSLWPRYCRFWIWNLWVSWTLCMKLQGNDVFATVPTWPAGLFDCGTKNCMFRATLRLYLLCFQLKPTAKSLKTKIKEYLEDFSGVSLAATVSSTLDTKSTLLSHSPFIIFVCGALFSLALLSQHVSTWVTLGAGGPWILAALGFEPRCSISGCKSNISAYWPCTASHWKGLALKVCESHRGLDTQPDSSSKGCLYLKWKCVSFLQLGPGFSFPHLWVALLRQKPKANV